MYATIRLHIAYLGDDKLIEKTCCFSGHRRLPQNRLNQAVIRLHQEVEGLISEGVTDFISGGALGFDLIAAAYIVAKKEMGSPLRLIFALPCKNHTEKWPEKAKDLFWQLLKEADEVYYVSDTYEADCMKKRNRFMVDRARCCICALLYNQSGTGQTVAYARKKQRKIINLLK